MKTPIEHLRNLSAKHKRRVNTASQIAENMKKEIEAAKKAALEGKSETA